MTEASPPPWRAGDLDHVDTLALGAVLDVSHHMSPDLLAHLLTRAGAALGASASRLYLVDYEQVWLMSADGDEPIEIDNTLAGRAFMFQRTQESHADGVRRLWVPLINGTERLGILGFDVEDTDPSTV